MNDKKDLRHNTTEYERDTFVSAAQDPEAWEEIITILEAAGLLP